MDMAGVVLEDQSGLEGLFFFSGGGYTAIQFLQAHQLQKRTRFHPYGFDTAYEISKEHQPYMVTYLYKS